MKFVSTKTVEVADPSQRVVTMFVIELLVFRYFDSDSSRSGEELLSTNSSRRSSGGLCKVRCRIKR